MIYVLLCELNIHLNRLCKMSWYNSIIILLDMLYMQSRCVGGAFVVQSVPSAQEGAQ